MPDCCYGTHTHTHTLSFPPPKKTPLNGKLDDGRYPSLIKYSVTESKQLVVDNAFIVRATFETTGDPVTVAPRYYLE